MYTKTTGWILLNIEYLESKSKGKSLVFSIMTPLKGQRKLSNCYISKSWIIEYVSAYFFSKFTESFLVLTLWRKSYDFMKKQNEEHSEYIIDPERDNFSYFYEI